VHETEPPAGCRGGIILYSVTRLFRRTSNLWQRPPALLIKPCSLQASCRGLQGLVVDGCRGLGLPGLEEEWKGRHMGRAAEGWGTHAATSSPGTPFQNEKDLCKVWVLLLRHHLQPQLQQHRRTDGLKAAGNTRLQAELPPSPPGLGTQLCAHPLPDNGDTAFAYQPALRSLVFTPAVPGKL